MCRRATIRLFTLTGILVAVGAQAQNPQIDWRHIGNSAMELGLPSVATGPVNQVWYSADGSILFAQTSGGRTYETTDFERWSQVKDPRVLVPPAHANPAAATRPETGLKLAQTSSS